MSNLPTTIETKTATLLDTVRAYGRCAVAYSGGVDSAVIAKAAQVALGEAAVAVTAVSHSLASGELEQARATAELIGIRHEVIHTSEFENPAYIANSNDRCYHCKSTLYSHLDSIRDQLGVTVLLNGANLDDRGDYRPGMKAAAEFDVHSPLLECGFTKEDVRTLARHWELPVWDKPAAPCLSSRVAYGEEVTPQRLRMIDAAEQFLRQHDLPEVRVRYHRGDMARIEVPTADIARLCSEPLRGALIQHLTQLGFKFVTLDLQGFRSGSLNALISVDSISSL